MTTKEQERKALAKIREIAEGLGEDSYVLTAFKGAFELAEENIDNDFACSMEDRVKQAEKETDGIRKLLYETQEKLTDANRELEALSKKRDQISDMYDMCSDERGKLIDEVRQVRFDNGELVVKVKDRDDEIVRLKAKLYDLLYDKGA